MFINRTVLLYLLIGSHKSIICSLSQEEGNFTENGAMGHTNKHGTDVVQSKFVTSLFTSAFNITDCGRRNPKVEQPTVVHGYNSSAGEYPWHVGLYFREDFHNEWKQGCAGSIITAHLILTAAHCVVTIQNEVRDARTIKVIAGKYYRNFYAPELYSQTSDVREILMSEGYAGSKYNYQEDIALLELANPLSFNRVVMPCCVDWLQSNQIHPFQLSMVVGWGVDESGKSSEVLKQAGLPYLPYEECVKLLKENENILKLITSDKFCAGYANGTVVGKGDSGGGLVFPFDGRYYVHGVVSVKPSEDIIKKSPAMFTNVTHPIHMLWMKRFMLWSKRRAESPELIPKSGECLLPRKDTGTDYNIMTCGSDDLSNRCRGVEDIPVSDGTELLYFCHDGYYFIGVKTKRIACTKERWIPSPPTCKKKCNALFLEGSEITCKFNGSPVDCKSFSLPGTVVKVQCSQGYIHQDVTDRNEVATCLIGGQWSNPVRSCIPACGKTPLTDDTVTNIQETIQISPSKHPWFVGIYRRSQQNSNGTYEYYCPSTLINSLILLTSASYIRNKVTGAVIDPLELMAVGGKRSIDWDEQSPSQERIQISEIVIVNGDMALLVLDRDNNFETLFYHACFTPGLGTTPSHFGTIAGWDIKMNETNKGIFQGRNLRHLTTIQCREMFNSSLTLEYFGQDKFCAIADNYDLNLDSTHGLGYLVNETGFYRLIGMASHQQPNQTGLIIFTNVTHHRVSIRNAILDQLLVYSISRGFLV